MAEGDGLLNRYTLNRVSGVRIPLSPPTPIPTKASKRILTVVLVAPLPILLWMTRILGVHQKELFEISIAIQLALVLLAVRLWIAKT